METPLVVAPPNLPDGLREKREKPTIPPWIGSPDQRDGAAVRVQRDSKVRRMQDLRGKRTAAPDRFSTRLPALAAAS